jgi:hypothetical protein
MYGPGGKEWGCMIVFFLIGLTFGLWKIGECAWWLVTHVRVVW